MAIVRPHVETVEVVGLDEVYLELDRAARAASDDAADPAGDRARHRARLLGRDRAEQARGEGRLGRREARGASSSLTREQAASAFRRRPVRPRPGDRTEDRRAARSRRDPTLAQLAGAPSRELAAAFGPTARRRAPAPRAVRGRRAGHARSARWSPSRVRRRSTADIADPGRARADARAARRAVVRRLCTRRSRRAGRSGSRSGSTTSPPTPGLARWPSRWRPRAGRTGRARAAAALRSAAAGASPGRPSGRARGGRSRRRGPADARLVGTAGVPGVAGRMLLRNSHRAVGGTRARPADREPP